MFLILQCLQPSGATASKSTIAMSRDSCPGCMFVCQPDPWSTTINKTTSCQQQSLGNGASLVHVLAGREQGWRGLSENTSQRSTMASSAFIGPGWPTAGQFQHCGWSFYQINCVISWFQHQPLKPGSLSTNILLFYLLEYVWYQQNRKICCIYEAICVCLHLYLFW